MLGLIFAIAELYLNYAEAMNEAYGPSQEVYDAINIVRERAGIPTVEESWGNTFIAKTPRNTQLRRAYAKLSTTNV